MTCLFRKITTQGRPLLDKVDFEKDLGVIIHRKLNRTLNFKEETCVELATLYIIKSKQKFSNYKLDINKV